MSSVESGTTYEAQFFINLLSLKAVGESLQKWFLKIP